MALRCFTEIVGSLFGCTIFDDEHETFGRFPDCLVIDILRKLPADSLLRCRGVCRDWRALISSHYFTTLHDRSRTHRMLLIQDNCVARNGECLYVIGGNMRFYKELDLRVELMIRDKNREYYPYLVFSCEGVILFVDYDTYYVFNPCTGEVVILQHALHPGLLCALYLCSLQREFKLLYAQRRGSCCQYLVYIFKTKKWRKIGSPSFNFLPRSAPPAVVNGALHWIMGENLAPEEFPPCTNGIMVFKMDKEELSGMPLPGSLSKSLRQTMTLLVKDDCLALCQVLIPEYAVDIWILEDYQMRAWIKRYKVNLLDRRIFPFTLPYCLGPLYAYYWIHFLSIQDGALVFQLGRGDIHFYYLHRNAAKRIVLQEGGSFRCMPFIESLLAIA